MNNYEYEKNSMIHQIDDIIDEIDSVWRDFNYYQLEKMNEVWNDSVSREYISKFDQVSAVVFEITKNLNNLKLYWKNYENDGGQNNE